MGIDTGQINYDKYNKSIELCKELIEKSWEFAPDYQLMHRFPHFCALSEIPHASAVCIYGAGKAGKKLYERMRRERNDLNFQFFLDSALVGDIEGIPVQRYGDINPLDLDGITICIASVFWREILSAIGDTITRLNICIFDPEPTKKWVFEVPGKNALFVMVPKTGHSSVSRVLMDQAGISPTLMYRVGKFVDLDASPYHEFWKFSFIRNPLDRLVSFYHAFKNGLMARSIAFLMGEVELDFPTFAQFVTHNSDILADPHWRSQHTFITDAEKNSLMDFVGCFDNLEEDFEVVKDQLGVHQALPHLGKSKRPKSFMDEYALKTLLLIKKRYSQDFKFMEDLGYNFDPIIT